MIVRYQKAPVPNQRLLLFFSCTTCTPCTFRALRALSPRRQERHPIQMHLTFNDIMVSHKHNFRSRNCNLAMNLIILRSELDVIKIAVEIVTVVMIRDACEISTKVFDVDPTVDRLYLFHSK